MNLFHIWLRANRIRSLGKRGEKAAARLLFRKGYHIWKMNWRCKRGEIDLIAYRSGVLIFVEVKTRTRRQDQYFEPIEAVTAEKQRKIVFLSRWFMRSESREIKARRLRSFRYDVVSVVAPAKMLALVSAEHIENAFVDSDGHMALMP